MVKAIGRFLRRTATSFPPLGPPVWLLQWIVPFVYKLYTLLAILVLATWAFACKAPRPTPRATSARAGQTVVPEPGFPLSVNFDKRGEPPPVRRCTKFASAVRCCRHHALSGVTSYQGSGRS